MLLRRAFARWHAVYSWFNTCAIYQPHRILFVLYLDGPFRKCVRTYICMSHFWRMFDWWSIYCIVVVLSSYFWGYHSHFMRDYLSVVAIDDMSVVGGSYIIPSGWRPSYFFMSFVLQDCCTNIHVIRVAFGCSREVSRNHIWQHVMSNIDRPKVWCS